MPGVLHPTSSNAAATAAAARTRSTELATAAAAKTVEFEPIPSMTILPPTTQAPKAHP